MAMSRDSTPDPHRTTLGYLARECAFTISMSYLTISTLLLVFFDRDSPAATIPRLHLLGPVVACSMVVLAFMSACTWLLRQLSPQIAGPVTLGSCSEQKDLETGLGVSFVEGPEGYSEKGRGTAGSED